MKLKLVLALLCLGCTVFTYGQNQRMNITVLAGYAGLHPKAKGDGLSVESTYADGIEFGLALGIELSEKLVLEPAVIYSNIEDEDWLFVPLHFKYKMIDRFKLLLGPQVSYGFADTEGLPINKAGLDLSIGLNYDITNKLSVEARYAFEITNRTNEPIDLSQYEEFEPYMDILGELDLKTRMNSVHITLGYKIF